MFLPSVVVGSHLVLFLGPSSSLSTSLLLFATVGGTAGPGVGVVVGVGVGADLGVAAAALPLPAGSVTACLAPAATPGALVVPRNVLLGICVIFKCV